ncbi:hypothetical protein [Microlunatus flavus]|uniref:WD40-like Beta Propeller Repeat n=1 Tax=Microlunatus flavus TaxID=1036181 RepID=A0A1H9JF91_9ACTN|nr:hypothetical protein [Microlunatus flavus]SEQ85671.1 hypothetical protein SAMN05421756_106190 [Microlunatus flavus]
MATSGDLRLVRLLAGLATAVLLGGTACSGPAGGDAAPTGTPSTAGPTAAVGDGDGPPCTVALPASWDAALHAGVVAPQAGETLTVALGLGDGSAFAVSDVPGVRHALVRRHGASAGEDPGSDVVVQDLGLDHPEWQVLGATWDGRHLAYRVDRSYADFEDFALYVWDSQGGRRPVEVAHGERDADGKLMQTPFVDPVLADGWLYWTQTRDADPGRTVVSGYRLADGHVERLARGFSRAPVRFGDLLVRADSAKAAQTSSLRALDLAGHRPAGLPAPLASVRGPYYLAADEDTFAWVGGAQGDEVWVWRAGWPAARLLAAHATGAQFPRVAGDTVVWTGDDATWVGDLRSWSAARLTPSYGGVWADGGPVVTVAFAPQEKGGPSVQALLDTTSVGPLGRAGC